ncbi:hypothetical protein ACP70R_019162 [Stipagrostis hirtigluma subsp. patula]
MENGERAGELGSTALRSTQAPASSQRHRASDSDGHESVAMRMFFELELRGAPNGRLKTRHSTCTCCFGVRTPYLPLSTVVE